MRWFHNYCISPSWNKKNMLCCVVWKSHFSEWNVRKHTTRPCAFWPKSSTSFTNVQCPHGHRFLLCMSNTWVSWAILMDLIDIKSHTFSYLHRIISWRGCSWRTLLGYLGNSRYCSLRANFSRSPPQSSETEQCWCPPATNTTKHIETMIERYNLKSQEVWFA